MSSSMISEWLSENKVKACPPVRNGSDTKYIKTDTSRVTKVSMPSVGKQKVNTPKYSMRINRQKKVA